MRSHEKLSSEKLKEAILNLPTSSGEVVRLEDDAAKNVASIIEEMDKILKEKYSDSVSYDLLGVENIIYIHRHHKD